MLILSRRLGESIVIGEDISVTILGVTANQIRIGIDAPKTVTVHREEIYQRINKEINAGKKNQLQGSNHLRSRAKIRGPSTAVNS